MKITVYNHGGIIHFHKSGCKDLSKPTNKFFARNADTFLNLEEALDCFLDKGDEEEPGWLLDEMKFFPCTKEK